VKTDEENVKTKMSMKNLTSTLSLAAAIGFTAITTASATSYDFSYNAITPDGTVADGQLIIENGLASSGYLDVASGPDVGHYLLVSGQGSDSAFVYDNFVFPNSDNGFVDSTAGLLWSLTGTAGNSEEMNLWFNPSAQYGAPSDTYSLWGAGPNWDMESYGTAVMAPTLTSAFAPLPAGVPDSGSTLALLAGGLSGLLTLRRTLRR
jgi:hypothetical protein